MEWLTFLVFSSQTYIDQWGCSRFFLKIFALDCNSWVEGTLGSILSFIPILGRSWTSVWPFLELQCRHAVTVLVHVSLPPLDLGTTWSRERSLTECISQQYWKVMYEGFSERCNRGEKVLWVVSYLPSSTDCINLISEKLPCNEGLDDFEYTWKLIECRQFGWQVCCGENFGNYRKYLFRIMESQLAWFRTMTLSAR